METQHNPPKCLSTLDNSEDFDGDQQLIARQKILKYVDEKKKFYNSLLTFLENTDDCDIYFQNLIRHIDNFGAGKENRENYEHILHTIVSIANNHHRDCSLFTKIFHLIKYIENGMKQTFTNTEIFHFFRDNKILLLFLFDNKIIKIDENIYFEMESKIESNGSRYCHFFYPEIHEFSGEQRNHDIKEDLLSRDPDILESFDERRRIGENDSHICSLIRQDSVEEFISYVHKESISLKSQIVPSLFETNSFLIKNQATLIEYSAFFGSIQIFQYLMQNKVELEPSLWLYAIHSQNAEIIQLLEDNKVQPPKEEGENIDQFDDYDKCFVESIKCHHNNIADYIYNKYSAKVSGKFILSNIMKYHNYEYFPADFKHGYEMYYLCIHNYTTLVDLFMKKKEKEIEGKIREEIPTYL